MIEIYKPQSKGVKFYAPTYPTVLDGFQTVCYKTPTVIDKLMTV